MNCDKHLPDVLIPHRRNGAPEQRPTFGGDHAYPDQPADDPASDLPAALSLRRSTNSPHPP